MWNLAVWKHTTIGAMVGGNLDGLWGWQTSSESVWLGGGRASGCGGVWAALVGEGTFRNFWNLKHWPVEIFLFKCHLRMIKWCINSIFYQTYLSAVTMNILMFCGWFRISFFWPWPLFWRQKHEYLYLLFLSFFFLM